MLSDNLYLLEPISLQITSHVAAVAVEVVTLHFEGGKKLVLSDCLYVPGVRRNLVSVSCLSCNGYSSFFNKNYIFIKLNSMMILYVVEYYQTIFTC